MTRIDNDPNNDNKGRNKSDSTSNVTEIGHFPVPDAQAGAESGVGHAAPREQRAPGNALRARRPLFPLRTKPVGPPAGESEPRNRGAALLVLSTIILSLLTSAIITIPILPGQLQVQPGVPAAQDIISPVYLSYASKVLTDKARDQASKDPANEVWAQDANAVQFQRAMLLNALAVVQDARQGEGVDITERRQRLAEIPEVKLTHEQIDMLLVMSERNYTNWRDAAVIQVFDSVMRNRRLASEADVRETRASLQSLIPMSFSADERAGAIVFVSPLLAVNVGIDEAQTTQRREQAEANIKPIIQTVQRGEAILRRGDIATPEAIEKMQEAGLLSRIIAPEVVIGTTGIVSLLMILLHLYVYRYVPQVWRRQKQLLLMGMLLLFTVVVARFLLPGHTLLPYFLPVAAISMLIAVLLNNNLAMLFTFVISILLGIIMGNVFSMEMPLYFFVGGLTGIFTLTKVERVGTFARAGFYISVVSFMAAFMLRVLMGGALDWNSVGQLAVAASVNAAISTSLTFVAFSLLGTLFGITTPLQLMELAHPDQPLLRRLMREAPGTYHHSLVVSNLAEHAAEMIGADPLLTRVCAYYHDIGKVERPHYFIDNQAGRANIHDELDPWASAAIIARHVADGIALGQKNNLPRRVLDAIPQHHGTMLIKFFYYKALDLDPNANPDDFRYPGPRPQTKENAILMLADGVEAAVRAMAQSGALDKMAAGMGDLANRDASESPALYNDASSMTVDAIAEVVHKIISERIEDGQLDECDLTVRDIARIQEAFVSMLKGIYHPRVNYPDAPRSGTSDSQRGAPLEPVPLASQRTRRISRQRAKQA